MIEKSAASCRFGLAGMVLGHAWLGVACGGSEEHATGVDAGDVADDVADASADATVEDPEYPCPNPLAGFAAHQPGTLVRFTVSCVSMIGQQIGFAIGEFQPAAREDFEATGVEPLPMDTCAAGPPPKFSNCSSPADCSPEQQCVPERDMNGNPIEGTDHCETPRSNLNVGPLEASGFRDGPKTFSYNSEKGGAYTATSDGSIDPASIAYDTEYTFSGPGDPARDLGPFCGTIRVPPHTAVISPTPTTNQMGAPQISVSVSSALDLAWSGSSDGEVTLTLQGLAGDTPTMVRCRTKDDGAFTIPADMVEAAKLGDNPIFNTLMIERKADGQACGQGVTVADVTSETSLLIYVSAAP